MCAACQKDNEQLISSIPSVEIGWRYFYATVSKYAWNLAGVIKYRFPFSLAAQVMRPLAGQPQSYTLITAYQKNKKGIDKQAKMCGRIRFDKRKRKRMRPLK